MKGKDNSGRRASYQAYQELQYHNRIQGYLVTREKSDIGTRRLDQGDDLSEDQSIACDGLWRAYNLLQSLVIRRKP